MITKIEQAIKIIDEVLERNKNGLVFCPVCGKLMLDGENIDAVRCFGMCLLCDNLLTDFIDEVKNI